MEYKSIDEVHKNLRYGKVMYMTDQDLDGSHIKGLCINMFHSEWASLTQIPGFLSFMNTPILRAKKGAQTKLFYNDGEYNQWKQTLGENGMHGWNIKYFKGLGTSTSAEFKNYFANKKIVDFVYAGKSSDDTIDMIFNKNSFKIVEALFDKLSNDFTVAHIHPNNSRPIINKNSINIPELLEFTFLRNDRVELNDEKLQFPHALDEQCAPHRPPRHLPKCWWS